MTCLKTPRDGGFTLVEVTIILLVLVVLGGIMTPLVERYIELSRLVRAQEDLGTIASAIAVFLQDAQEPYFKVDGNDSAVYPPFSNRISKLVSEGDIPGCDAAGDPTWQDILGFSNTDLLSNHLVVNNPFGGVGGGPFPFPFPAPYRQPWRKYLASAEPDPWGFRYAVNVEFLDHRHLLPAGDVVVYCTGPDGTINSPYTMAGFIALGDDISLPLASYFN